jgi:hypothetical protein
MGKVTDHGDWVEFGTMDKLPLDMFIKELEALDGVRVYDADHTAKKCKIGMQLPDGKSEIEIVVDVMGTSYIDVDEVPLITPSSYLQIERTFRRYDLQLARTRNEK